MGKIFGGRARITLLATTASVAVLSFAAGGQSLPHSFNISSQPVQDGIAAFARQAGVQIVVAEDAAQGVRVNRIRGQYDAKTGLKMLLAGTGLGARETGEATYSIVKDEKTGSEVSSTAPETVIVTGRAGSERVTRVETSYSISVIPQERIREKGVSSVADTLRNIPGFWVENSGGEASANIRARGIPVDGYASVQLEEDGMPIQHDPGLGYLNADQSFRLDETVGEVQAVRGGPSSIFAPNAPGGVVNFITRKPTEEIKGLAKLTVGDDDLYRGDFWLGGPLGAGWRAAIGGFYRVERGVRDPGYNFNNGGQFRVYAERDLADGSVSLDYKHIDDKVGFYLPIPVARTDDGGVASVAGFNASTGILNGPQTQTMRLLTDKGPITFHTDDGTAVKLDQFTAKYTRNIGDGWLVENRFRLRSTSQDRIGLYTGSVQTGALRASQLLPQVKALLPNAASLQLRYVDSPNTVFSATQNGNGLEVDNNARDVSVSEHEVMDDLHVSKMVTLYGQEHDLTLGGYIMSAHETFGRYSAVLMMDVQNQARLLNLVALDAGGNVLGTVTDNGVLRYGTEFANGKGDQLSLEAYIADEWHVTDALRIDLGLRYANMHTNGAVEGSKTVNLGLTTTLADKAYLTGSGIFTPYSRTYTDLNWTVGANWQFSEQQGVFARVTHAERMPSISDFITNPTNTVVVNKTDMYELGYKLSHPLIDVYLTAFDTEYHNFGVTQYVYDNVKATYATQNYYGDTRDYGLELDGVIRPLDWFDISFSGTLQNPTFTSLKYTTLSNGALVTLDYNGNQLLRVPKMSVSVSPTVHLLEDRLMAQLTVEHYSDRYADAANTQLLPAYTVLNMSARYQVTEDVGVYLSGYNLTNAIGLTEGNPRAGEVLSSQAGAPVYLARPILGRNFRMSLLYKF